MEIDATERFDILQSEIDSLAARYYDNRTVTTSIIDNIESGFAELRSDVSALTMSGIRDQIISVLQELGIIDEFGTYHKGAQIQISEERFMKFVEEGLPYE